MSTEVRDNKIGEAIRKYRLMKRVSAKDLADKLKITDKARVRAFFQNLRRYIFFCRMRIEDI